jgi:small subunit ribosomal protein S5
MLTNEKNLNEPATETVQPAVEITAVKTEPVLPTTAVEPSATDKAPNARRGDKRNEFGNRNKRNNTRVDAMGFEEKVVGLKRISKTTKGGRRMRFSALVVIGDKNGKVGYGIGKSTEVPNAIKKAIKNARNQVTKVIMNKRNTLYHEIIGRHGASRVLLKPAPEGTGIIAGGAIRAVIELAGFKDIYTKNLGSNTSSNMVQATINGLINQRHPMTIASLRDKELGKL